MAMTISGMVNSGFNFSNMFPTNVRNQNAAQQSISNMWNAYSSAQNNATANAAALQEVRTNASALVASYDEAKTAFYNEFDANMNDLSASAKEVKDFDFQSVTQAFSAASKVVEAATEKAETAQAAVTTDQENSSAETVNTQAFSAASKVVEAAQEANNKAQTNQADAKNSGEPRYVESDFGRTIVEPEVPEVVTNTDGSITTTNEDGSKVTSYGNGAITKTETYDNEGNKHIETAYSKVMQSAMKTIQDFVDDYNSSIEFFQDNNSVSARVGRMAELFGDTTYRAQSYESIGINVQNDGTLAVDQEKLARAIVDNPEKVSSVVGDGGLADKAESHVNVANSQRSQLFPSAQAMFGQELSTASFYTSGAYLSMNSFSNLGNLVNMMF